MDDSDVEMVPIDEDERPKNTTQMCDSISEKSVGIFTTGIDIFSKEEKLKMDERAKRFGLTEKCKDSQIDQDEDLYSSMGITDDGENMRNMRLNVIHMRGTEEMSTKDVLTYFQDYAPQSIEWINDISCNVCWFDNISAARAMLGLSKRIIGNVGKYSESNHDRENKDSENREDCEIIADVENDSADIIQKRKENYINIKDINCPLPPGIWRKGTDYPKSKGIFLRFATRMDRKQGNAEKMSEYYKKYGNPNFGGIKGILTESRKRMYKQIQQQKRKLIVNDRNQSEAKDPWGALSETWGLNDVVEDDFLPRTDIKDQGRSIKERLGAKSRDKDVVRGEKREASSNSDSEEDWCKRSKVLRMRMHADDEEEKVQKRRAKMRYQMVLNNLSDSGDLRSKLRRPRRKQFHDTIQIVVTNTNLTQSNSSLYHDSEISRNKDHQVIEEIGSVEREEGEWADSENEHDQQEEHGNRRVIQEDDNEQGEEEDQNEEGEYKEQEEDSTEEDSDVSAKEIQGPKGSVIKVVPSKPRVASTVWTRLNRIKSEVSDSYLKSRRSNSHDLRNTLRCGDLRSRIGNHTRGRSPLRIEVKNDKYTRDESDRQ